MKPTLMKQYPGWPLLGPGQAIVPAHMDMVPITIAPGAVATTCLQPREWFRADYVLLERPHLFRVFDIRVGLMSQIDPWPIDADLNDGKGPHADLLPERVQAVSGIMLFMLAAARVPLRIAICPAMSTIDLLVENASREPTLLAGKLVGWQTTTVAPDDEDDD